MPSKYAPEIRAEAVRLVREHGDEYDTEWAVMKAISARLGMNVETLRKWVRQDEVDSGQAPGCRPAKATSCGSFVYTAFVIDAFAGRIVGGEYSASKHVGFVERAIRHAEAGRAREGKPLAGSAIHHNDAGAQGGFNWSSQHLDRGGATWHSGRT